MINVAVDPHALHTHLHDLSTPAGKHYTLTDTHLSPIKLTSSVSNDHAVKHTQSHRALRSMLRVNTGR